MNIARLIEIMAALRTPGTGCPWDLEQDFRSIAPYTIEEAYEVADAIERGDLDDLKDELGDLLLQVVFHAQMADEAEAFAFDDVAGAICDKLIRRHPHVFGGANELSPDGVAAQWSEIKAREKAARAARRAAVGEAPPRESVLDGVPKPLPALTRAIKLQEKAAKVGFDWADARLVLEKLREETLEVEAELSSEPGAARRRRSAKKSAISCSSSPIWRATPRSIPNRRCAPPTPNSSGGFITSRRGWRRRGARRPRRR